MYEPQLPLQTRLTGHVATREFRHQPNRHQETTSPPNFVYEPQLHCREGLPVISPPGSFATNQLATKKLPRHQTLCMSLSYHCRQGLPVISRPGSFAPNQLATKKLPRHQTLCMSLSYIAEKAYRSSRHQEVSPPTNSPPRNYLATNQTANEGNAKDYCTVITRKSQNKSATCVILKTIVEKKTSGFNVARSLSTSVLIERIKIFKDD